LSDSHPTGILRTSCFPGRGSAKRGRNSVWTFRDVERASYQLASVRGRSDFIIHISRLAAIENEGTIQVLTSSILSRNLSPESIEIFNWYEVPLDRHFSDGAELFAPLTHLAAPPNSLRVPMRFDPAFDPRRTELLSRMVESWKHLEGVLFDRQGRYLYGYVGLEDHMMEPLLSPGSLVLVDPARRQVRSSGWNNEFERPIYFRRFQAGLPFAHGACRSQRTLICSRTRFLRAHRRYLAIRRKAKWWGR